jgi:hypothetical protein
VLLRESGPELMEVSDNASAKDQVTEHPYRFGSLAVFFLACAICAFLYFATVIKSLPAQDDFCRAAAVPVSNYPPKVFPVGLINSVVWEYNNWTPRWAGIGLETILLRSVRLPDFYPALLVFLAAIQCLALYVAIKQFLHDTRSALFLTALVASIYWTNMPDRGEGLFWLPAAVEYQLGLALFLLLFSLLASSPADGSRKSVVGRTIVGCILAFLLPAFHELLGAAAILIATVTLVTLVLKRRPQWKMWAPVWAAAAIGFLIVFVAPGNAIRSIHLTHRAIVRTTLLLSLDTLVDPVLIWCLDLKLWLLALLIWVDPHFASVRRRLPSSGYSIGMVFCVWVLVMALAISAPIWQLGYQNPTRVLNVIYGLFLIGWIVMAFLLTRPLATFPVHPVHRAAMCTAALILLALQIVANQNNLTAASDIYRGRLTSWNAQLDRRFHLLRSVSPGTDVRVEPLSVYPRSFQAWDISPDPEMWSNRCLAQYYHMNSVATQVPR